jgi:uncharacterized delta-60 repeat protein
VLRLNANDGTPDSSFGQAGTAFIDFGSDDFASGLGLDGQGNIVVTGWTGDRLEVARLTGNGELQSHNILALPPGVVPSGPNWNSPFPTAVQADGSLMVTGGSGVARFTADDHLDTTFGDGGSVLISGLIDPTPTAVAVQSGGKIVVLGESPLPVSYPGHPRLRRPPLTEFAVTRLNPDGSPDPSFGDNGRVTTDFPQIADDDFVGNNAVAVQPDGKVLVAGRVSFPDFYLVGDQTVLPPDSRFAVVRYNADGSLDATFGDAGRTLIDFHPLFSDIYDVDVVRMAVDGRGRILVAGALDIDYVGVARLDSDGSLDASFGDGGEKILDPQSTFIAGHVTGIAVDGRNGILVTSGYAVARLLDDGSLDSTFGVGGKTILNGPSNSFVPLWVSVDPQGRIVLAGESYQPGTSSFDFAVARLDDHGNPDTTFGTNGRAHFDFSLGVGPLPRGFCIDTRGRIVMVGYTILGDVTGDNHDNFAFAVARLDENGTLDTTFGDHGNGRETIEFGPQDDGAEAVAVQPDGKIVVAGTSYQSQAGTGYDFAVARLEDDGTLDQSFGDGGRALTDFGPDDGAVGVAIQPDGKIVVAGMTSQPGTGLDFAVARYLGDDQLTVSANPATVAADLQQVVSFLQNVSTYSSPPAVVLSVDATTIDAALAALASLTPDPAASQPVPVVFDLGGSTVSGQDITVPAGVSLTIRNGTLDPDSPALTVTGGQVSVVNCTLTTTGDAPTILVQGGSLKLRNDVIQESTGFNDAAIAVTGGTVDLGTAADPGGNTPNVNGTGTFLRNTTANHITAVGDSFEINGQVTPWPIPLTVTTRSSLVLVGSSPPPLTGSVNGTPFTGSTIYTTPFGDTVTVTLGTAATSASPVGRYDITASLSGADAGNYVIIPSYGTLYVVSVGADPTSTTGAQAVTFWDNRGNARLVTAADLSSLDALNLVNQGGAAFDPRSVAQLQAWLSTSPNATAAYQLAVQLAALGLNVLARNVQATDLVFAGGLLPYASADNIAGLTSGGFIDVQNLMQAANAALGQVSPGAPAGDPNQAYELALAQVLQAANGNTDFVQQAVLWNLSALDLAFLLGV